MIMYDIIISLLSENSPKSVQHFVINLVLHMKKCDYKNFIRPYNCKKSWKNCALILTRCNDANKEQYLDAFFEWLQDFNWPGSDIVYNYLQTLPQEILYKNIEKNFLKAISKKDEDWVYNLYRLYRSIQTNNICSLDESIMAKVEFIVRNY